MGLLAGKRILVTGVASNRSIAWGVARAMHREGAELAFTFQNERLGERVRKLAAEVGSTLAIGCDVSADGDIDRLFHRLGDAWPALDGLVHAIAFAPREALDGDFLSGLDREAFRVAHDVSAYSFAALAAGGRGLMRENGGSMLTLTYLGSQRVFPNYNVMGPAKASLEATVRYLAENLGPEGIRVNAILPGPVDTPLLQAAVTTRGPANTRSRGFAGRMADPSEPAALIAFLASEEASYITGQGLFVDGGLNAS